jgi:hypothetical protein
MAARSVAGSRAVDVSGGGPKQKQRRLSKVDEQMAASLGSIQKSARKVDEEWVWSEVQRCSDTQLQTLTTMFKTGALWRAMKRQSLEDQEDDVKGQLLSGATRTFKALNDTQLDALLARFNQTVFTPELLLALSRQDKKDLINFGLQISPACVLPQTQYKATYQL